MYVFFGRDRTTNINLAKSLLIIDYNCQYVADAVACIFDAV